MTAVAELLVRMGAMETRIDQLENQIAESHARALDHAENLFAAMLKLAALAEPKNLDLIQDTAFNTQEAQYLALLGFERVDFHRVILTRRDGDVAVTCRGCLGYTLTRYIPEENDPYNHYDSDYPVGCFSDLLIDLAAEMDLAG